MNEHLSRQVNNLKTVHKRVIFIFSLIDRHFKFHLNLLSTFRDMIQTGKVMLKTQGRYFKNKHYI